MQKMLWILRKTSKSFKFFKILLDKPNKVHYFTTVFVCKSTISNLTKYV